MSDHLKCKWCVGVVQVCASAPLQEAPFALSDEIILDIV